MITTGCPSNTEESGGSGYTVTFDKNSSDATEPNPAVIHVDATENRVGRLPTAPTRSGGWNAGMTFDGWNTSPDGTGSNFNGYTPVTGNITVYAKWKFSPGRLEFPNGTMVHNAPELTTSPADDSTQGTFDGRVNDNGSITFSGGAVRYKFLYDNDEMSQYDFFTIEYVSSLEGNPPFKVISKQYDTIDDFPTFGDNIRYHDLEDRGSLTFARVDAGKSNGFAMQFNTGGADNGTIKFTKVTFTRGTRHKLYFMDWDNETDEAVEFSEEEGFGSMEITKGIPFILPAPGKDDYYFIGWANGVDSDRKPITNKFYSEIDGDVTLSALWFKKGDATDIEVNFSTAQVQGRGRAFTSESVNPKSSVTNDDNSYTLTYGGTTSDNTIGYANTWVKFNITIPGGGYLSFYKTITFTIEGTLGDCTYKPVYVLAGTNLGTDALNFNAAANLLAESKQYTSGSRNMTFEIDPRVAASMKGTLEVAIYTHSANYASTVSDGGNIPGRTTYKISNVKFTVAD
jgi:uncharacterized repeat protein (TIGR02543 family)